jgi:hypothetical protein
MTVQDYITVGFAIIGVVGALASAYAAAVPPEWKSAQIAARFGADLLDIRAKAQGVGRPLP